MVIDKKKLNSFLEGRRTRLGEIRKIVEQALDYDALLNKYGPEGLYMLADKLKEVADADVAKAIDDINNNYKE